MTNEQSQKIAAAAVELDAAKRELANVERTARGQTIRDARRRAAEAQRALDEAIREQQTQEA